MLCVFAGRLDIDVNYVEDCKRLAKQCKIGELIEELEVKCKQVQEFGKTPLCVLASRTIHGLVPETNPDTILTTMYILGKSLV